MMRLSNEFIDMEIAPAFGARIVSLTDRRSGRNWLVPGDCVGNTSDMAIYGGLQARGWDECFPTIAPCRHPVDGKVMRDHGDLWGRPWTCSIIAGRLDCEFSHSDYRFCRSIGLHEDQIEVAYQVENRKGSLLAYIWSQHCLLATTPDDRIELNGFADFAVSGGVNNGLTIPEHSFDWPELRMAGKSLNTIMPEDARFALKAYGLGTGLARAKVLGPESGIAFSWNCDDMPCLGLWLDYGGWPADAPVRQIAIEPTTAAADDLEAAARLGHMRQIPPGGTHSWKITIELIHHSDHGGPADVG